MEIISNKNPLFVNKNYFSVFPLLDKEKCRGYNVL